MAAAYTQGRWRVWLLGTFLSCVADHLGTLELGVWRIREGNVSLELSFLVMELASPVTLRGIVLASCPCSGLQCVMCSLLKHSHSWRKQHPSPYSFYSSGMFFICVAPCGFLCSFHWWWFNLRLSWIYLQLVVPLLFIWGRRCVFSSLGDTLKTVTVMQMCSFQQIYNILLSLMGALIPHWKKKNHSCNLTKRM